MNVAMKTTRSESLVDLAAGGASALDVAHASVREWTRVHQAIAPVVGERGAAALYRRALHLARSDRPWMDAVYYAAVAPGDFVSLHTALSAQDSAIAAGAHEETLRSLRKLLALLIGKDLAAELVSHEEGRAAPHTGPHREANERKVIAAMEDAYEEDQVSAPRPADTREQEQEELRHLRVANQRLVAAALESHELETAALEAHRRQVSFLATIAHELRNPLMPLRLAAQMLDRARTDDVAHAKLQATIQGQVAQMTRLIGDLLDGSRISTGKFRLERTLVDLGVILDRAVETCVPGMDERGHRFTRELLPGKTLVLADTVRMVQVFVNLLENSSKYSLKGGHISMRTAVGASAVTVTITDNGIGITPAALPHVFDMFVRDAHASGVHEGLGIGLAIVRELVRAHEGTVSAASRGKDLGSEFVITLPLGAIAPITPA